MFCRNCGKQLEDGFKVCPYCGEPVSLAESDARRAAQEQTASEDTQPVHNDIPKESAPLPAPAPVQPKANKKPEQESESTGGWKVLGFFLGFFGPLLWFLPLVSLVLYLIWKSEGRQWYRSVYADRSRGRRGTRSYYCNNRRSAVCDNRVDDCV